MYVAEAPRLGVIGFADFGVPRDVMPGFDAELCAIYLLPEFQGKSVGREIFLRAVGALVGAGKKSLYLLALEASPYRSFYEKLGGRMIGRSDKEIEGEKFVVVAYGWDSLVEFVSHESF